MYDAKASIANSETGGPRRASPLRQMAKPEIHLAAYSDATTLGGAERCLATILARLGSHFRVTVVATSPRLGAVIAADCPNASLEIVPPVRNKRDLGPITEHIRVMRALRPDVCHVNLRTPYAAQYGLLAAFLAPAARVVAVEHLPLPSSSALTRSLKRFTSARLAAHIGVGDRAARLIEEDAGLPANSITVINNGVDSAPRSGPAVRLAPGIVIGSAGRLVREKGYELLVEALTLVPTATAVVVGEGPERGRLESLARKLGVEDRLVLTGWKEDVAPYLRGADVFALPSRAEGLPLAILEAMQMGLPIVATDVGSVAEAVTSGRTGLLVPPDDVTAFADALGRLVVDQQMRTEYGNEGRALWQAKFGAARMARKYEQLYERLIS
jgi:glycosyltransferase involved in cell wall biosynthesis